MSNHRDEVLSSRIGEPLDVMVSVEAADIYGPFTSKIVSAIGDRLGQYKRESTTIGFDGTYNASVDVIKVFNGDPRIEFHERAHQELERSWPSPDFAFNESWAHASTDYYFEREEIGTNRHAVSLRLCPFHSYSTERFRHGGISPEDKREMLDLIAGSKIGFTQKNWPAFQVVVQNLRFYGIFWEILQVMGYEKGKEMILSTAAGIHRKGRLLPGLNYLAGVARANLNNKYRDDSDYELNSIPVWEGETFSQQGLAMNTFSDTGDLSLEVRTISFEQAVIIGAIIQQKIVEAGIKVPSMITEYRSLNLEEEVDALAKHI